MVRCAADDDNSDEDVTRKLLLLILVLSRWWILEHAPHWMRHLLRWHSKFVEKSICCCCFCCRVTLKSANINSIVFVFFFPVQRISHIAREHLHLWSAIDEDFTAFFNSAFSLLILSFLQSIEMVWSSVCDCRKLAWSWQISLSLSMFYLELFRQIGIQQLNRSRFSDLLFVSSAKCHLQCIV